VNLYPQGWETATERDGSTATITKPEAKLIRQLVQQSIENGVLRWRAGTQVERKILATIIEGVQLIGFIDVYKGPTEVQVLPLIEDHKSYGKGSTRYLKRAERSSPNYLGDNQQLKTYAWAISELDGWEGDVTVRHNQFPKFAERDVTAVETVITREEIVEHGEYLREVATRMERTRKIKKWADVPGPKDTGKCARWYGKPCPFSDICGRAETPDAYQARLERLKAGSPAARLNLPLAKPKKRKTKENDTVSIFDRANKQKQARAERAEKAGSAQAKTAVAEAPPVNGGAPAPTVTVSGGAPWANPSCKACKGRGLTSRNTACPICDNTAKKAGRPTSMAYILEVTDEGTGIAVAREENADELEAAGLPLEWDESEAAQAAPQTAPRATQKAPESETAPEPESKPEAQQDAPAASKGKARLAAARRRKPAAEDRAAAQAAEAELAAQAAQDAAEEAGGGDEPQDAEEPQQPTRGRGRPSTGLTILIGATYLRGLPKGRTVVTSSEVIARFGAELASDMGADSFWELDPFKRRERLAQKADYIASSLAKHVLVHPGILGNDDEGKLVQALMGLSEGIDLVIGRIS
jgi:hypothetical protein